MLRDMSIRAIDSVSVHKICSGQVITDLSSAVKELIENSLDSGATVIEIRLKNSGADTIDVSDNGGGIDPSNYGGLAMKHHTSKLKTFSDLKSVASFGFRGEALNALCELSGGFTVVTKRKSESIASSLTFHRNGELDQVTKAARAHGTTVTVTNLFELLPVRRSELLRSLKKQYIRLLKAVQSYAVISVGVKISLITIDKGGRNTVIDTQANAKLSENISFVFGSKFLQTLIPLDMEMALPMLTGSSVTAEDDEDGIADSVGVRICGFISKAGVGVGRSDNDRQFVFCNGRPVDLPKITRMMNEVWRKYEMKQKPAFILNVITPPGTYDVNISPDKREVVLTNEDYIIDSLKSTIDSEYESSRYTFTVNSQADSCTQSQLLSTIFAVPRPAPSHVPPFISSSPTTANSDRLRINDASSAHLLEVEDDGLRPMIDQMDAAESEDFECGAEILSPDELLDGNCHVGSEVQSSREDTVVLIQQKQNKNITYARDALQHKTLRFDPFLVMQPDKRSPNNVIPSNMPLGRSSIDPEDEVIHSIVPQGSTDIVVSEDSDEKGRLHNKFLISILGSNSPEKISYKTSPKLHVGSPKKRSRCLEEEMPQISSWSFDPASVLQSSKRKRDRVDSRVDAIFRMPESEKKASDKVLTRCEGLSAREGEAGIRVLSKEDFKFMRVIGQFNLGFIIAELRGDLYILDQHACDEKYRFETLQQSTIIHQQPLIRPLLVDLTYAEELVVAENLDVFTANGFKIETDLAAPAGRRTRLTAVPFSKGVQFGVDDVRELASLLSDEFDSTEFRTDLTMRHSDSYSTSKRAVMRLPKLLSMFASRACRQAVMIGTHLSEREMVGIVQQLVHIEQPWNCPHGRPTMRHLADLATLRYNRDQEMLSQLM